MKTLLKIAGGLIALLLLVALCGYGYLMFAYPKVLPPTAFKIEPTPERLARGKYLTDHVVGCTEALLGEPIQAPWPKGVLVERLSIVPREQCSEAGLHRRKTSAETGSIASDVSQQLVLIRRDVRERDLIDPQQIGQELCVQSVCLASSLHNRPQQVGMGE